MDAQISQTEKTQGAFIVHENVMFIWGGKVKKLTEKVGCKPASAVGRSESDNVCANG